MTGWRRQTQEREYLERLRLLPISRYGLAVIPAATGKGRPKTQSPMPFERLFVGLSGHSSWSAGKGECLLSGNMLEAVSHEAALHIPKLGMSSQIQGTAKK
ncbi:hypothetical protein [Caballeronia mineralivorans]|jgi:hypothetical protein|uniref:hypothetical protein n=1 Tax=Caballeronia mineralivorans TaxID=2010198 RepID=UPI0023EF5E41|nr:hypothetical protein [Caballeronia mineralivorans]MDB5787538.1 hypothetical protein [Caballeronia mineralivorans]MEA3105314.1 hypothetical protein [Caballeronia mineralivorans]